MRTCAVRQPGLAGDVGGDQAVVPGDELRGDAEVEEPLERLGDPGPERVVEDQQAQEGHPRLVALVNPGLGAHVPIGDPQGAQALAAELGEEPLDLRAQRVQIHHVARPRLGGRADFQHARQRPLGHQQVLPAPGDQHAESLADEIVGLLVELAVAGRLRARLGDDGRVDRVGVARLEGGVEIGVEARPLARLAAGIDDRVQPHLALGQRAGLVRAEHVHAAEVLDGRQPADDDPLPGHAPRPVGQVDADDRREQLRGQPDGDRHGEEERLQDRPVQGDVDGEDGQDQQQGHLQQQVAEVADAALEPGLRRPEPERPGDPAEFGIPARADDQEPCRAADDAGAQEEAVRTPAERGVRRHRPGCLLDGEGLAGQGRLGDEQVRLVQDAAVAGDDVAGVQEHDVPRHHLLDRDLDGPAVAEDARPGLDEGEQFLQGIGRPPLLPEAEQAAGQDDGEDDEGVGGLSQEERQAGGDEQDQDDRALELRHQERKSPRPPPGLDQRAGGRRRASAAPPRPTCPGAWTGGGGADPPGARTRSPRGPGLVRSWHSPADDLDVHHGLDLP